MSAKKAVLVVGNELLSAGLVTGLDSRGFQVTVASQSGTPLPGCPRSISFLIFELSKTRECENALAKLVKSAAFVICLTSGDFQGDVLHACIEHQRSMITPFALGTRARHMEHEALEAGITILSEVGMSPGLDHVTTVALVERLKDQGHHILKMETYCGGLPITANANNPFKYKFARSAVDVLTSAVRAARLVENDQVTFIKSLDIMRFRRPYVRIPPSTITMEAYPNGDSTAMILQYGLHGVQTYARYVVRYEGFCMLMKGFGELGLLDLGMKPVGETWLEVLIDLMKSHEPVIAQLPDWVPASSEDVVKRAFGILTEFTPEEKLSIIGALNYVGALAETPVGEYASVLHAFSALLDRALQFKPDERDFVFLDHLITYEAAGTACELRATLEVDGTPSSCGAITRLAAIHMTAAAMWMDMGHCVPGLMLPLPLDYVEFVLAELQREGVSLQEKTGTTQPSIA